MKFLLAIFFMAASAAAQTPITGTCTATIPPAVSVTSISLLGTSLPDGVYGVSVKSNAIVGVSALSGSTASGTTVTVSTPAQAQYIVNQVLLKGVTVAPGQVFSVTPVFAGAPAVGLNYLQFTPFVNSAGAMYLRLQNNSAPILAMSFTVVVK